jgi:hypothetical protein
MLVKDHYLKFMGKKIFVDITGDTAIKAPFNFEMLEKYKDYKIMAIEAYTETTTREHDNAIIVEPVICLYIMKEGTENE